MHQASHGRRHRRQHSPQYKAELVQLCLTGGASLASIAIDHGLNPNLLRRWVQGKRLGNYIPPPTSEAIFLRRGLGFGGHRTRPVVRQELIDPVIRMCRQALQDVAQIGVWIQAIELG
ncbi:transposase [Parapusillimonas sp. JC17]|uniref:transposase n=1 Tax=Parapusillimonas sp. JC17 TaxID=3445768 RepID=UPI003F9EF0DA